ncbi:F-box domain, cyclin-like protein [Artemisia annua]|uniref:F-box domain, cyclin-like protein n=1 Tax=Artemisia annua TaxID=35608 RepID=A0A2U1PB34_ARTAN|nr:F-box domain, cyclin-like protein [Artemisia annua]
MMLISLAYRFTYKSLDEYAKLLSKQAVQTSLLSKSWVSSWKEVPTLELRSSKNNGFKKLRDFDKFVRSVLYNRNRSLKLDTLTFVREGVASAKILKEVLNYAFSHGVKHVDASINVTKKEEWPVYWNTSSDALLSLNLTSMSNTRCPFLEPEILELGPFKNLTVLYLKGAIITDSDSFSQFPELNKLTLDELTVSCSESISCIELITPKLKLFEYKGINFPVLKKHDSLAVLETVAIDFQGTRHDLYKRRMFEDLLVFFKAVANAKSLTMFSPIVHLLYVYRDEVKRCFPFRHLEFAKLDFGKPGSKVLFYNSLIVKGYSLKKSPYSKCKVLCPTFISE